MLSAVDDEEAADRVVLVEVAEISRTARGVLQLDVAVLSNPGTPLLGAEFGLTRFYTDNKVGLSDVGEEAGLLLLSARTGRLMTSTEGDGGLWLTFGEDLTSASAVSQTPIKGIREHSLEDLVAKWDRLQLAPADPERLEGMEGAYAAALSFYSGGDDASEQIAVLRLGKPVIGPAGQFSLPVTAASSNLEAHLDSDLDSPSLVLGSASTDLPGGCASDDQCLGSQWCDTQFRSCFYSACGNSDSVCGEDERCLSASTSKAPSSSAKAGVCIPDTTGVGCSTSSDCLGALDVCGSDGLCRPKSCVSSAQCGITSALCLDGVCQAVKAPEGIPPGQQIVSVGCGSVTKSVAAIQEDAATFCETMHDSSGKQPGSGFKEYVMPLCQGFFEAMVMRTQNLAELLHRHSRDESDYCYTVESGKNEGFGFVHYQDCGDEAVQCGYTCPSDSVKKAIRDSFGIFTTTIPNYENRLSSFVGNPDYTPFPDATAYSSDEPLWQEDLLLASLGEKNRTGSDWWGDWWDAALNDYNASQLSTKKSVHSYQNGDAGGGCTIQAHGSSSSASSTIVTGGGFGFSVSPEGQVMVSDQHGMHACGASSISKRGRRAFSSCSSLVGKETATYGHNVAYCRQLGDPPGDLQKKILMPGSRDMFGKVFSGDSENLWDLFKNANTVSLTCGGGATPSFSAKPADFPGDPKVTYSYGTGGGLKALITRIPRPTESYSPVLAALEAKAVTASKLSGDCPCELDVSEEFPKGTCGKKCTPSPYGHPTSESVPMIPGPDSRGILHADGARKWSDPSEFLDGIAAVYEPYHFELKEPAGDSDSLGPLFHDSLKTVYIPGSNSPPEMFVENWKKRGGLKAADGEAVLEPLVSAPGAGGLASVFYTLNINPLHFDYENGPDASNYRKDYPRQWGPVARSVPPRPDISAEGYGQGEDARYYDINAMAIETLIDSGIEDISLVVPLTPVAPAASPLVCDSSGEPPPSAVVQMNSYWIDQALALAQTYNANAAKNGSRPIKKIVLGDGAYPVKQGFNTLYCNQDDWLNTRDKCQGVQEYFRFEDYMDLLIYVRAQISPDTGKIAYPDLLANGIEMAIAQRLNVETESAVKDSQGEVVQCQDDTTCQANEWCYRSYASAERPPSQGQWYDADYGNFEGTCVPRTGWTECTNVDDTVEPGMSTSCSASGSQSFIEYYLSKLVPVSKSSGTVKLAAPVFLTDLVTWSVAPQPGEAGPRSFAEARDALAQALGGLPVQGASGAFVQAGWSSQLGGESFSQQLLDLKSTITNVPGNAFHFVLDQLFDQPWKGLPIDLPGMPRSECGRVLAAPAAPPGSAGSPPGGAFFPAVCAGTQMPWGANVSKCLCLNNLTDYPVQAHPFVSDLDGPDSSGKKRLVSPNVTTTYPRHRYRSLPNPPVPATEQTFSEFAVFGSGVRASSYTAGKWMQWPEPLLPYCPGDQDPSSSLCPRCLGCKTWNNMACSPCETKKGQWVEPRQSERDAIPATRCGMNSDAQTKYLTFNNALQCPRLWYQFYCESDRDKDLADPENVYCDRPTLPDYNNLPDFDGRQTPYDAWDLQCETTPEAPLYDSVTRIERSADRECLTLKWTAKGSAFDWASGWELKTLAPECAQGAKERAETPPSQESRVNPGKNCKGLLKFEQAPMTIVPQQDLVVDSDRHEVSGTFEACDPNLFPNGLKKGQYWWRIQPFAGEQLVDPNGYETLRGSVLASVDAIDIEYDPICHTQRSSDHASGPVWDRVGKFTVGIWKSSFPEVVQPPTRFSKISRVEFRLPPAYTCGDPADVNADGDYTGFASERGAPCAPGTPPGTARSFFITPERDNITSDFTLPGQKSTPGRRPPSPAYKRDFYTTSMFMHVWDPIFQYQKKSSGEYEWNRVFWPADGNDKQRSCRVDLLITAAKNFGDQGGQAKITRYYPNGVDENGEGEFKELGPMEGIPVSHPEWACYLELQGDNKTVNGANFEFCGDQAKKSNLCMAPCDPGRECCVRHPIKPPGV